MGKDGDYLRKKTQRSRNMRESGEAEKLQAEVEASQNEAADAYADADANDFLRGFMGVELSDVQEYYDEGSFAGIPHIDEAMKAVNDANKAWTKGGRRSKAVKATKGRKGTALKKAAKKTKSKKGCGFFVLLIGGAIGGALYGSYEGVTALVTALGN